MIRCEMRNTTIVRDNLVSFIIAFFYEGNCSGLTNFFLAV